MLRATFYAASYWAPVLLILLLVMARVAAPFPYRGADYSRAIEASLIAAAEERADSGNLYVKVDGVDPSAEVLADLNSRKLPATFVPWSLRPHFQCAPNRVCSGAASDEGPPDNFLIANILTMPLWHVALVRVNTSACSAEFTLLRATQWHSLSQRTTCGQDLAVTNPHTL
jgi:hypothetical protein